MRRGPRLFFLAAGLCDGGTGIALLAAPAFTLGRMGLDGASKDPALVRFVGAFVLGVGLAYLLALLPGTRPGRLSAVASATALVRACVGSYVTLAIAAGSLELAWWSVAATDLGLAVAQGLLVRRGWFDERP